MVRSWLAKKVITRNLRALNRGDVRPTLRMDAPDVHFRFPGTSSWATDVVGRDNVEEWLNRMVATGLQHEADDVVASRPTVADDDGPSRYRSTRGARWDAGL